LAGFAVWGSHEKILQFLDGDRTSQPQVPHGDCLKLPL
jgi:hypothetical protein